MLGISRNTVKAALACDGPPKYQHVPAGSVADGAEPRIRELLAAYPRMLATVTPDGYHFSRYPHVWGWPRGGGPQHDALAVGHGIGGSLTSIFRS